MAKGPNQKAKLLFLMRILCERTDEDHPMTIAQLSDALAEYGISAERKSLYDDIEVLRYLGVDVVSRRDKTYGYYVGERDFELAELKILVDAVQSSKFITHRKSNELIKKIENRYGFNIERKIDNNKTAIRLVTSWATKEDAVDEFINYIKELGSVKIC